jgi:hypothetical protein
MRRTATLVLLVATVLLGACGDDGEPVGAGDAEPADGDQVYEADLTVLQSPDHGPELCYVVAESFPPQCGGPAVTGWDWAAVEGEERANGTTWGTFHIAGTWSSGALHLTEAPTAPAGDDHGSGDERDFSPGCADPEVVDATHGAEEWATAGQDVAAQVPDLVTVWVSDPTGEWDGPFTATVVVRPGSASVAREAIRASYAGPLCVVERDAPSEAELTTVQTEVDAAAGELGLVGSSVDSERGVVVVDVWVADDETLALADERWGDLVELRSILQPAD